MSATPPMPSFRELLRASDAELVKAFYRLPASGDSDFIKRINHAAAHLGLNHTQLVCALGFNPHMAELADILAVVGFSSFRPLSFRRNELFTTDAYRQLTIDNVLDVFTTLAVRPPGDGTLTALHGLLPARLEHIEQRMANLDDTSLIISYKIEVHAIYAGGLAGADFIVRRLSRPIGDLRLLIEEVPMIVQHALVPPSNLFFSDDLLPGEKRYLIENGHVDAGMIANRLRNSEISEDERQMLEDFV
jgi:hypothetical protein